MILITKIPIFKKSSQCIKYLIIFQLKWSWVLRITWSVKHVEYFTDQVIRKAHNDFPIAVYAIADNTWEKKKRFTVLTSMVDGNLLNDGIALRESLLDAPPQQWRQPQRRRRRRKALRWKEWSAKKCSDVKKKRRKEWRRSRKKNQEEEAEAETRGRERVQVFFLKNYWGHYGPFTTIAGCTTKTVGCT